MLPFIQRENRWRKAHGRKHLHISACAPTHPGCGALQAHERKYRASCEAPPVAAAPFRPPRDHNLPTLPCDPHALRATQQLSSLSRGTGVRQARHARPAFPLNAGRFFFPRVRARYHVFAAQGSKDKAIGEIHRAAGFAQRCRRQSRRARHHGGTQQERALG